MLFHTIIETPCEIFKKIILKNRKNYTSLMLLSKESIFDVH